MLRRTFRADCREKSGFSAAVSTFAGASTPHKNDCPQHDNRHTEEIDMLSQYFEAAGRIRAIRSGPSGTLIEGFSKQLFERGYSEISARHHIRSAEHLLRWASRRGLSIEDFD